MQNSEIEKIKELKKIFLKEYAHFADKRIKNLDKGNLFIVDDRSPKDFDAHHNLFLWFCSVFIEISESTADSIKIIMRGNIPDSESVSDWIKNNNAMQSASYLTFQVGMNDFEKILSLASAFRAIVAPGAHYRVRSYKYVCPRTAITLERLHKLLTQVW